MGRLISKDATAYTYLPQSVAAFPEGEEFCQRAKVRHGATGFTNEMNVAKQNSNQHKSLVRIPSQNHYHLKNFSFPIIHLFEFQVYIQIGYRQEATELQFPLELLECKTIYRLESDNSFDKYQHLKHLDEDFGEDNKPFRRQSETTMCLDYLYLKLYY